MAKKCEILAIVKLLNFFGIHCMYDIGKKNESLE